MKRILCSICIGSLALTLTAWGQPNNDRRPDRAKAQRTANVRATRPANTGAMTGAHRYTSTAPVRQRTYMAPRTNPNRVVNQDARMRAFHQRNFSSNRDFRARRNVAVDRDRNFAVIVIALLPSFVRATTWRSIATGTSRLIGQETSMLIAIALLPSFVLATA